MCISETIPSLSVRLYLYQTIPTTLVGWSVAGPGRRCGRRQFVARPGVPELAERAEAVGVVGDGEEAPRRLPRRQDLRQSVQRLQPQRVRLQTQP